MKKVYIIGLNFRLCSLAEAEEIGCERVRATGPNWVIPRIPAYQPDLLFPPQLYYAPTSDPSVNAASLDLTPRDSNTLLRMKEFYECFKNCEEKIISAKVFKDLDSLFLDEQHPNSPFSPSPLFNPASRTLMGMNYRLQQRTLDALDSAVGSIYDRGAWVEDYVNLFIVKKTIFIFVGRPIVYVHTDPSEQSGMSKFGFGYMMIRPEACIKLVKK